MNRIAISKRQRAICDLIPQCSVLCDVGCDHGKTGYTALLSGKVQKVVFIDISSKCLDKARKLCADFESKQTEFVQQDGLQGIRCDCAIIAGMGGLEILKILSQAEQLPPKLLLQPMRDVPALRAYLQEHYTFVVDTILLDKKYYDILYLESGRDDLTLDELNYGRTNVKQYNKDFVSYAQKEIVLVGKIMSQTNARQDLVQRLDDLTRLIRQGEYK